MDSWFVLAQDSLMSKWNQETFLFCQDMFSSKTTKYNTLIKSLYVSLCNDPTVMSAFQANICGRFAPLATLIDEDDDLDSMVTHLNKMVTDTAVELLGKQRRKKKPWVISEIIELCDQRRDLKKKRGQPEGAKDYREINKKTRTEMKMTRRLGYGVKKWKHTSERITARRHTS